MTASTSQLSLEQFLQKLADPDNFIEFCNLPEDQQKAMQPIEKLYKELSLSKSHIQSSANRSAAGRSRRRGLNPATRYNEYYERLYFSFHLFYGNLSALNEHWISSHLQDFTVLNYAIEGFYRYLLETKNKEQPRAKDFESIIQELKLTSDNATLLLASLIDKFKEELDAAVFAKLVTHFKQDIHWNHLLCQATNYDNPSVVKVLLDHKADINQFSDKRGVRQEENFPLAIAAKNGHSKVINLLLECKAKVTLQDRSQNISALTVVCDAKDKLLQPSYQSIVKRLIAEDKDNATEVLINAARLSNEEGVRALLEQKVDPTQEFGHFDQRTTALKQVRSKICNPEILFTIALLQDVSTLSSPIIRIIIEYFNPYNFNLNELLSASNIASLLVEAKADPQDGLWQACEDRDILRIKILLDHNADPNLPRIHSHPGLPTSRYYVLHQAVVKGDILIINQLLDAKAQVDNREKNGLNKAIEDMNASAVQLLLQAKAKPDDPQFQFSSGDTSWNQPALSLFPDYQKIDEKSFRETMLKIAKMLIEAKADVNAGKNPPHQILMNAAAHGHIAMVELVAPLVDKDILAQSIPYALDDTSSASSVANLETMLACHPNPPPNTAKLLNQSIFPFSYRSDSRAAEFLKVFGKFKLDLNQSHDGQTCLDIANKHGLSDSKKFLIEHGAKAKP